MLYFLAQWLEFEGLANLVRYQTFRAGAALMTALVIGLIIGPRFISMLRVRQGKGQPIRDDGPKTHLAKKGTPTMGGLMILSGVFVSSLLWANLSSVYVWVVLIVTLGFGAIGFYDDYLKVTKASHKGFSGRVRLLLEFLIAAIACFAIMNNGQPPFSSSLTFPFFKDWIIETVRLSNFSKHFMNKLF